jgi:predicted O-methyltransferase YrrM
MNINLFGSVIKKIFGQKVYIFIKFIYAKLFESSWITKLKIKNYDTSKDLNHNLDILKKYNLDVNFIKINLDNFKFINEKLSWHYYFFAGLKKKKFNILEIGTHKGEFTKFCALCNDTSNITTIDAPDYDDSFLNAYQKNSQIIKSHIEERTKNCLLKNINFIEINSFHIIEKFNKNSFDYIWIDGDHLNPQVSFDIFSSLRLIKDDGYILVDDIVKSNLKNKQVSNESFETIEYLKQKKVIEVNYLVKRITKFNKIQKKFIAILKKN